MKKRIIICFALLVFAATVFAGGGKESSGKKIKIGYCINNFNDTFQTYIVDAIKTYLADKPDVEFITADGQEDVIIQQDQVNSLITKGVHALIVVPVDTSAMAPITRAAANAGIPLCYVNRNPFADGKLPPNVFYVGSQEITAGEMQIEYIGKKMNGKGGVAILQGILSNEGALKRTEGNEKIIAEKFPGIKVLAKETGKWQRDQGMIITENWLTAYGKSLNAVLANNDEMALGAVRVLRDAGRTDVFVIGIDGIPDARAAIKAGELAGSVLQDAKGQGEGSITTVLKVLRGEKPESITWVPFKLITPENVKEFD